MGVGAVSVGMAAPSSAVLPDVGSSIALIAGTLASSPSSSSRRTPASVWMRGIIAAAMGRSEQRNTLSHGGNCEHGRGCSLSFVVGLGVFAVYVVWSSFAY